MLQKSQILSKIKVLYQIFSKTTASLKFTKNLQKKNHLQLLNTQFFALWIKTIRIRK